jgi:hypothetical protein
VKNISQKEVKGNILTTLGISERTKLQLIICHQHYGSQQSTICSEISLVKRRNQTQQDHTLGNKQTRK